MPRNAAQYDLAAVQEMTRQAVEEATTALRSAMRADFAIALNRACDEVAAATEIGDAGVRDVMNLLVNAAGHYVDQPQDTLEDVAEANYSESLATVLGRIAADL